MEAAQHLPAPAVGAAPSTAPILPPSRAKSAPTFERRDVQVTLVRAEARTNGRSVRRYLYGAVLLAALSAAGWFGFAEYIYG